jgi:CHRD domain-containing protein
MNFRQMITAALVICAMSLSIGTSTQAQSGEKFKVRLAPVPRLVMDGQRSTNVAANVVVGSLGSATAVLSGRKLTVNGTFEKLASKPTAAHLFLGPMTGVRDQGKPVFDLAISKQQSVPAPPEPAAPARGGQQGQQAQQPPEPRMWYSGAIDGSVELTPGQVDALKKGRFYIQVHSEGMPSGHLLGWLLK